MGCAREGQRADFLESNVLKSGAAAVVHDLSFGAGHMEAHSASQGPGEKHFWSRSGMPLTGQSKQLIDSEGEHAEHQVRHDLTGSTHANGAAAKLVLKT